MSINELDVRYAYRLILGREPESEAIVERQLAAHPSLGALRASLLASKEFRAKLPGGGREVRAARPVTRAELDQPKLVFVHIPKTAGTTLHAILTSLFAASEVCPERFNAIGSYPAAELARFRLYSGHFDVTNAELIPGPRQLFTMLRDPVARLQSLYYFQKAHEPEIIDKDGLHLARLANACAPEEFFALPEIRRHPAINNTMVRFLAGGWTMNRWEAAAPDAPEETVAELQVMAKAATANLSRFVAVGITERFDDSMRVLFAHVAHEPPAHYERKMVLDTITTEDVHLKRVERVPFSPAVLKLIEPLVAHDRRLYKTAITRLNKALARLG